MTPIARRRHFLVALATVYVVLVAWILLRLDQAIPSVIAVVIAAIVAWTVAGLVTERRLYLTRDTLRAGRDDVSTGRVALMGFLAIVLSFGANGLPDPELGDGWVATAWGDVVWRTAMVIGLVLGMAIPGPPRGSIVDRVLHRAGIVVKRVENVINEGRADPA